MCKLREEKYNRKRRFNLSYTIGPHSERVKINNTQNCFLWICILKRHPVTDSSQVVTQMYCACWLNPWKDPLKYSKKNIEIHNRVYEISFEFSTTVIYDKKLNQNYLDRRWWRWWRWWVLCRIKSWLTRR
jgi:hypothetical protein